jgi:hypothetical protein
MSIVSRSCALLSCLRLASRFASFAIALPPFALARLVPCSAVRCWCPLHLAAVARLCSHGILWRKRSRFGLRRFLSGVLFCVAGERDGLRAQLRLDHCHCAPGAPLLSFDSIGCQVGWRGLLLARSCVLVLRPSFVMFHRVGPVAVQRRVA